MPGGFEATEQEMRLGRVLVPLVVVCGFGVVALSNITDSWWPGVVFLCATVLLLLGLTAWAARTRRQTMWSTFWQITRSGR